jgi:geranylgeranyl pyrophosphate synthase
VTVYSRKTPASDAEVAGTEGREAAEVLEWTRRMLDLPLRQAVETLPPSMRRVAGYHFGWWDEQGRATEAGSGKALRPAFALLAAEAVGGEPVRALPAAVAVELVHNFSLVHDDVIDGDATRRHRPTAWSVFGSTAAILAGDSLLALAFAALADSGQEEHGVDERFAEHDVKAPMVADAGAERADAEHAEPDVHAERVEPDVVAGRVGHVHLRWTEPQLDLGRAEPDLHVRRAQQNDQAGLIQARGGSEHNGHTGDALRVLGSCVQALLDGQSADVDFERRSDVGLDECLRMAEGKTGALMGCACALGAVLGDANAEQLTHLSAFGERLGLAFQIVDDLLGIWGDPAVTGKPVYSDLRSRKKSLPVVAALTSGTSAAAELAVLYRQESPLSQGDLERAAALVEEAGGREWSRTAAGDLLTEALNRLRATALAPRPAAELEALARLAADRDR